MPKLGYVTPSRFADVMTGGKGKDDIFGLTAHRYAKEIALGLNGVEMPEIKAKALEHGNEYEPIAVLRYEQEFFVHVTEIETCITPIEPEFQFVCGLPDRLAGNDGILEVKCPINPVNHLDNILTAKQYEKDYKWQIQGYLWITGRDWCDFVSFNPFFPPNSQIFRHRITKNEEEITSLKQRILLFWQLVQEYDQKLKNVAIR